jgi:hypothetical protein
MARDVHLKYFSGNGRRMLVVALSLLFIADYLMFCHLTEKNVFAIFPDIPSLKRSREVALYLPTFNDMSIEKETREISVYEDVERGIARLFDEVARGSKFENTSLFVPLEVFVRKIWLVNDDGALDKSGNHCIIDIEPGLLDARAAVIPGSEELFRKALEKTIKANMPFITSVTLLERGLPGTALWDRPSDDTRPL